jgi:GAF domain-containing protein
MDHYSILDQTTSPQGAGPGKAERATESDMTQLGANRSPQGGVSALMAAVNGLSATAPAAHVLRFLAEDSGHSVTEMARRDLDAALQLLAERAQYITGASGAAIALRRGGNDMLCRASTGSNAPEIGALLSAEFGLSGESVRTRLPLRCDDAERDARVNREGCRQLGVASVAVMPIVSDDQVLGVFELFSGKTSAFQERDLSALRRLGEMVETAVRLAQTAQAAEVMGEFVTEVSDLAPAVKAEAALAAAPAETEAAVPDAPAEATSAETTSAETIGAEVIDLAPSLRPLPVEVEPPIPTPPAPIIPTPAPPAAVAVKKPLLWSAATQPATRPPETDQSHLPPMLRNLRKCQACGFPVSEGRTLCLDCEGKEWSGQVRVPALASQPAARSSVATATASAAARALASMPADKPAALPAMSSHPVQPAHQAVETSALSAGPLGMKDASAVTSTLPEGGESSASALPFLSSGVTSSESWFSANKYILGAIILVALVLAVIGLLR